MKPSLSHLPELDGLRGFALILVLLVHVYGIALPSVFQLGWVGVDLFFVLSGFLITRILLRSRDARNGYLNFLMRRSLRIFPLYFGLLFLFFVVAPAVVPTLYFERLGVEYQNQAWFWLYLQNWLVVWKGWAGTGLLSHFWSLAIEEQFYLLWPLVVFFSGERRIYAIAAGLIATSVVLRNVFLAEGLDVFANYTSTFTRLDGLVLGSCVATCLHYDRPQAVALLDAWARPVLILTGLFVFGAIVAGEVALHEVRFARFGYTLVDLFFSALLVLILRSPRTEPLRYVLRTRPLMALGTYSYGVYLLHVPVVELGDSVWINLLNEQVTPRLNRWLGYTPAAMPVVMTAKSIGLLLTFGLSWLSFHYYETPWLRLKRYFETDAHPIRAVLSAMRQNAGAALSRRPRTLTLPRPRGLWLRALGQPAARRRSDRRA